MHLMQLNGIYLVVTEGNGAAARKLGISVSLLRRWRRQREKLSKCKKMTKAFQGEKKCRWPKLGNIPKDWVNTQSTDD